MKKENWDKLIEIMMDENIESFEEFEREVVKERYVQSKALKKGLK